MMKNFVLGLIFIICPLFAFAHNPLSAKYHLEAGERVSLLTINLSQDGVNQALLKKYSERELKAMTPDEFKSLIVNYVKDNYSMSFDQKEIELKEGGVKLGSHQTDLKFVLPPISNEIKKLFVDIPAFQENENHQTIFSYKTKLKSDYEILSPINNYHSTIVLLTPDESNIWLWMTLIGVMAMFIAIILKTSLEYKSRKLSISNA